MRWRVRAYFDPHDLWRGVFWRYRATPRFDIDGNRFLYVHNSRPRFELYLCPLPCCVLSIKVQWRVKA